MNISRLLAHQASKNPNHEGIVTDSDRITYAQWNRFVNQLADSFQKRGVRKGDKVVLHMPNTKEFLYTYFAVHRLGAIIVPINAKLVQREIMYILKQCDAKVFVTHDAVFEQVRNLPQEAHLVYIKTGKEQEDWYSFETLLEEGSPDDIPCNLTEGDEASILYTSGTTGNPKGVVFTNRNILTVATMICIEMTMKPESRILHMMPLSHSAPLHLFLIAGTYVGATHVLASTFSTEGLLEKVDKEKTTHFFGAPVAYLTTAKHPDIAQYDLTSMAYWVYGGAPLSQHDVRFVKDAFATDRLMCVYGPTEAGPNGTLLTFDAQDTKAGSIGKRSALQCEIKVVDESGSEVKTGEVGEIILRGEGNMKGYYKEEEKTKAVLKNNWFYTGDMAQRDEDGYYWMIDRKKDMIISGGVNIYPKEIENVLSAHPKIAEVAVVGVPHPDWGETVKAFVVLEEDTDNVEAMCRDFLEGKIAHYKVPKLYEKMEALPRNVTGKLLKNQLREHRSETR
ncbi:long-chain-fatty-acid--CoA ligase [Lentibacillus kapialis]|uniref:Long-chain-fatty-acid--CoA ligase n=1 Tax=Lentibacillus kapialis TaxID=340214 RepID=A0A917PWN7_9BACI|nr:long-chain-fatty-acid--CoA ligase [Lentibacillus kapialis]GGJ97113.1 long-chain-fatty-acid--CoA ligase [Lentibacillus kapialis]